jgi:hypothetical protein
MLVFHDCRNVLQKQLAAVILWFLEELSVRDSYTFRFGIHASNMDYLLV